MKTFLNIAMIITSSILLSISFTLLFTILLFLMGKLSLSETTVGFITGPQLMLVIILTLIGYSIPIAVSINTLVVVGVTIVTFTASHKAYINKDEVGIRNIFKVWNIYWKTMLSIFLILFILFFIVWLLITYDSVDSDIFVPVFVSPLVTTLFYIMLGGVNGSSFVRYLRNNTEKKPSAIYYILQFLPFIDVISARDLLKHTDLYNLEK